MESAIYSKQDDTFAPDVKILGHGKVVRDFLSSNPAGSSSIQIYDRLISPFVDLKPSDVVLYACSINERAFLENTSRPAKRQDLFYPNAAIADEFLRRGHFNHGRIFVLSNPCELLAEYIRRKSGNPSVYALGLSNDVDRYRFVLETMNKYHGQELFIGGNHYDESCLVGGSQEGGFNPEDLREAFRAQVASEFVGKQPPVRSGVKVFQQLWRALSENKTFFVSGYSSVFGCYTGGAYCFRKDVFRETLGMTFLEKKYIARIAARHRKNMKDFSIL